MWRQMLVRIGGAESHRRAAKPARHRRISRRRAAVLLLLALLALAVGGVAYTVRRGVLNFTEDFGFGADGQSGGRGAACDQRQPCAHRA